MLILNHISNKYVLISLISTPSIRPQMGQFKAQTSFQKSKEAPKPILTPKSPSGLRAVLDMEPQMKKLLVGSLKSQTHWLSHTYCEELPAHTTCHTYCRAAILIFQGEKCSISEISPFRSWNNVLIHKMNASTIEKKNSIIQP